MTKVSELGDRQREYLAQMEIDPKDPMGTVEEIKAKWIHGAMCDTEFLHENKCDAAGNTSINACSPHGCPFVWVTKPDMSERGEALKYPVYAVPKHRINLSLYREFKENNVIIRKMNEENVG